ncbi:hypothetical protein DFS33DRAFT_1416311 [Desarmillaria ectypa]|nr:hypothetical protein DFS33DRAFT_1416311 [Desarmillaria ectypa]
MPIDKLSNENIKGTPAFPSFGNSVLSKFNASYNVNFSKAVETTSLDPWSKRAFKLYFIVMVGFLNAVSSGFDGSLMSGINVMDQYLDYWGRRGGMFSGGFFILLGAAIISSAQNTRAFLDGRFILGFGISISTIAAPTWVTELAPIYLFYPLF